MKGKFLKPVLKEKVLAQVEELLMQDMPQTKIAEIVGVSQPMISYYRKKLLKRYVKRQETSRDEGIALQCRRLEKLREVAWAAYYQSAKDYESISEELLNLKPPEDDGKRRKRTGAKSEGEEVLVLVKRVLKKSGRLPAVEYLRLIKDSIELESKLKGHFVEINVNLNQEVAPNWSPEEEPNVIDVKGLVVDKRDKE